RGAFQFRRGGDRRVNGRVLATACLEFRLAVAGFARGISDSACGLSTCHLEKTSAAPDLFCCRRARRHFMLAQGERDADDYFLRGVCVRVFDKLEFVETD